MSDTGAARLPGIPLLQTSDPALARWSQAVTEHLEVRAGGRGNPKERGVTLRELEALNIKVEGPPQTIREPRPGDIVIDVGRGLSATLSVSDFERGLKATQLYKDLATGIGDVSGYGAVPEAVRQYLTDSLLEEAANRGSEINRIESKVQTTTDSLAFTVKDVLASVTGAASGVRELAFAAANESRAAAGKVSTVQARLNNFSGGAPGTASVESKMTAVADRATGLEAQYTVKVQAGGAMAGFGLAATSPVGGTPSSAFLIQADKFAMVAPGYTGGLTNSPDVSLMPFGVDASGVYINGQVRINASGPTVTAISRRIVLSSTSAVFKVNAGGTPDPSSVTLTATLENGLTGTPSFTVIDGTATLTGSGLTRALAYTNMSTDRVVVRASVTMDGVTYNNDISLYKAFDGAAGAAGSAGSTGSTGAAGARGSVTRYGSGSFSDAGANALLPSLPQVIGDTVTFSTGSTATTRYWSGSAWVDPGVVIDGNLLVTGTLSASKINSGTLTAVDININSGALYVTASGNVSMNNMFASVASFGNLFAPTQPCVTATPFSGSTQPAIRANAAAGNALEAVGPASVTGNLTVGGTILGNVTGNLSGTASSAGYATSAGSASTANYAASSGEVTNSGNAAMRSSSNTHQAIMQTDGNFVVYKSSTPYWSTENTGGNISDSRLKEGVEPCGDHGLADINALEVVHFTWKPDGPFADGGIVHTGFIAQQVQGVIPAVVPTMGEYLGVAKEMLIPFLVKAVQELSAKVDALQTRVDLLPPQ